MKYFVFFALAFCLFCSCEKEQLSSGSSEVVEFRDGCVDNDPTCDSSVAPYSTVDPDSVWAGTTAVPSGSDYVSVSFHPERVPGFSSVVEDDFLLEVRMEVFYCSDSGWVEATDDSFKNIVFSAQYQTDSVPRVLNWIVEDDFLLDAFDSAPLQQVIDDGTGGQATYRLCVVGLDDEAEELCPFNCDADPDSCCEDWDETATMAVGFVWTMTDPNNGQAVILQGQKFVVEDDFLL